MPTNPYKEQRFALNFLRNTIEVELPNEKGMSILYNFLMRKTLLRYAVSKKSVSDFIKGYEEDGMITISKGVITINKDYLKKLKKRGKRK